MTTSEQLKITAYRENGMPYSEIAKALSLSVNTVKSYCKRHDMGGRRKKSADNILLCKQCGVGIPQVPKRKAKQFCSDQCRMMWWRTHSDKVHRKSEQTFICPFAVNLLKLTQVRHSGFAHENATENQRRENE